ncbi:MAG: tetratricopeptide repeat protein [Candidatus Hydrogenedentes bacterium]|nr:tetratricopeptide repeat protein [Candidatus Hydrogenedentota bacterium]
MMWWKRRRLEGAIAASLYDDLDEAERAELDKALSSDPGLRASADRLARLVDSVPHDRPELDHSLLPPIRARLADRPPRLSFQPRSLPARHMAVAACAVAAVLLGYGLITMLEPGAGPSRGAPQVASHVQPMLDSATAARQAGDYTRAFETLTAALESYPDDVRAGEAQYQLADLAFERGRYPEAFDAYTALKVNYGAELAEEPARERLVSDRRDLLDEASKVNYASLQELDAALRNRGGEFAALEQVIARYPALPYVAELASRHMALLIAESEAEPGDPNAYARAMEAARDRCTDPVAIAQLNLEIGHIYRDRIHDAGLAGVYYRKAAEVPVLARRAGDALGMLERATPSGTPHEAP